MSTVSFWTRKIIEQRPFIEDALSKGLINNAALAESLIPEIDEKLKKKVKFSAVNMAIRRLGEKLEKEFVNKTKFGKHTEISLKSNLVSFVIINKPGVSNRLKQLYNTLCSERGDFLTTTQGLKDILITANAHHEKEIEKIFGSLINKKIQNLSGLSINLPPSAMETAGYIYLFGRALALENINIVNLVYTYEGIVIIVHEDDATLAFDALRRLIKEN